MPCFVQPLETHNRQYVKRYMLSAENFRCSCSSRRIFMRVTRNDLIYRHSTSTTVMHSKQKHRDMAKTSNKTNSSVTDNKYNIRRQKYWYTKVPSLVTNEILFETQQIHFMYHTSINTNRAGLTTVPVVPWEVPPRCNGAP